MEGKGDGERWRSGGEKAWMELSIRFKKSGFARFEKILVIKPKIINKFPAFFDLD